MTWLPIIAVETIFASAITAILYWRDKRLSQIPLNSPSRKRRISEQTLLTACLLGGWPGGLWASRRFRHKTHKRSYRIQFWITVLMHVTFVAGVIWFL